MPPRTRRTAITEGVIAGILFGSASIIVRLLSSLDSYSIAFWRLATASAALSIVFFASHRSFKVANLAHRVQNISFMGLLLALHFIFFISAVKETTILNATVLVNTTPVFSVLLSSLIFKSKPSRFAFIGLVISFMGIVVVALAESLVTQQVAQVVNPSLKGDAEATLAAFFLAIYVTYGKKIRTQARTISTMLPIYAVTTFFIAAISLVATGKTVAVPLDIRAIILVLAIGLLPTAIAHTLYFSSLSHLKSFETATLALLEPLCATLLGIYVFYEIPAPLFALGAALVMLGILFIVKEEKEMRIASQR